MFGRKQKKIEYLMWKGVRIPKSILGVDESWKDIFVWMVMHVLAYRATNELDRSIEQIDHMRMLHVHRFSYLGGEFQMVLRSRYINKNVMALAIEEANRLEELEENDAKS